MRIHNIYADENGETHFRDIDIEMTEHGPDAQLRDGYPPAGSTSGQPRPIGSLTGTLPPVGNTSSI